MKITNEMIDYIRWQRTNITGNFEFKYEENIKNDYENIKEYLPRECKKVLDIGCGLGGIDLLIYKHYNIKPELHLFDYNSVSKEIYYGYKEEAAYYNSLFLAGEFLKLNGIPKTKIGLHEVKNGFPVKNYDLIISLISYGFHYPISTYIEFIKKYKGKIIILDIRKNTNQINTLLSYFNSVETVKEFEKYFRVIIK